MKKQWFQNSKRIISNGKRILCDECPCGYNCEIPTPTVNYNVPGDYTTLTAALSAHGSETTTRINITGTHTDIIPFFNCQICGDGAESTTLTGGCVSATGLIIKAKITTANIWKCDFSHCEITSLNTPADVIFGRLCDCKVHDINTGTAGDISVWNAGNGYSLTMNTITSCNIYDCTTGDGANGMAWVPGYEGQYGQRGGVGGDITFLDDILDGTIINNLTSGSGGIGFQDGGYLANGGDAGSINFGDDVRYDRIYNSSISNITSGDGGHAGDGGGILFGYVTTATLENILTGNGGAGHTDNFNRDGGAGGDIIISSVYNSSITGMTTGNGGNGITATKVNDYNRYSDGSAGGYGGDIKNYNYSIQDSVLDGITIGNGGVGGDAGHPNIYGGRGGRGGYFYYQSLRNSTFTNIVFGNGGNGGSCTATTTYFATGGTGGSFFVKEYYTTGWYTAYVRDSTFTDIIFGNAGVSGAGATTAGAGGGGFCQGGAGGRDFDGGDATFDIENHHSRDNSPIIHYQDANVFVGVVFGSGAGNGKTGGFGFNGGDGGDNDYAGYSGGDGMDGGTYYVTGDTTGWPVPQGGLGGSGDPNGIDGIVGQVISE